MGIVIQARPIGSRAGPCLLIDNRGAIESFKLSSGQTLTFHVDRSTKYCCGWYDIESHQNHTCESRAMVDSSYSSCFACRVKTDFNPAFYHSTTISDKQARYNAEPHSVYIAYFGDGLAKAGIMSDSRGIDRIYEQGALMYTIVAHCDNATVAHNIEAKLIRQGLRDSVQKRQKAKIFEREIDVADEQRRFKSILAEIGYGESVVTTNLDLFFYGRYPREPIELFSSQIPSGVVVGIVGQYIVFENTGRMYGLWLSSLFGYYVELDTDIIPIQPTLRQVSLF